MKKPKQLSNIKKSSFAADISAASVFLLLCFFFSYIITHGINAIDESFYLTIPHRLMQGDLLLSDEWHVSQLSSVLLYFPFKLYYSINGGTEGIVLFFRILFMVMQLGMYIFIYAKLRHKYGAFSIIPAAVFSINVPMLIPALSYYTLSLTFFAVVCIIVLTSGEKIKKTEAIFCGFALACGVLAEPFSAAVYFVWAVAAVLVYFRKKRKENIQIPAFFDMKTFLPVSAGVFACFIFFCAFFALHGSLSEFIRNLPEFFTDSEYNFSAGRGKLVDFSKIVSALRVYGIIPSAAGIVLFIVSPFVMKYKKSLKTVVLAAASVLFAAASCMWIIRLHTLSDVFEALFASGLPMFIAGPICYILTENRNPCIAFVFITGAVFSVFVDISSCLVTGYGSGFMNIAGVIAVYDLLKELKNGAERTEKKEKRKNNYARIIAVMITTVYCITSFGAASSNIFLHNVETFHNRTDDKICGEMLTKGPLKGIKTTKHIKDVYESIIHDLDIIKEKTDGPVYVAGLEAYYYLYLDLPYGVYSAWYVNADSPERDLRYYELHPEKKPAFVYVPYYNCFSYENDDKFSSRLSTEQKINDLSVLFGYTKAISGEAGKILFR